MSLASTIADAATAALAARRRRFLYRLAADVAAGRKTEDELQAELDRLHEGREVRVVRERLAELRRLPDEQDLARQLAAQEKVRNKAKADLEALQAEHAKLVEDARRELGCMAGDPLMFSRWLLRRPSLPRPEVLVIDATSRAPLHAAQAAAQKARGAMDRVLATVPHDLRDRFLEANADSVRIRAKLSDLERELAKREQLEERLAKEEAPLPYGVPDGHGGHVSASAPAAVEAQMSQDKGGRVKWLREQLEALPSAAELKKRIKAARKDEPEALKAAKKAEAEALKVVLTWKP